MNIINYCDSDTVAVIEVSRIQIAKQLNTVAMSSYWEIGKLIKEE